MCIFVVFNWFSLLQTADTFCLLLSRSVLASVRRAHSICLLIEAVVYTGAYLFPSAVYPPAKRGRAESRDGVERDTPQA